MLILLLAACMSKPQPAPTVLVVSFDTTRADAISSYGGSGAATPIVDGLASRGVRFAMALAHAPTTLSSHTAVMSGLDSHGHRVVRNGYPVPDDVELLAERFQAGGWDTVAVIGASTLDHRMGLNRGFRVYDDAVGTRVRRRYEDTADRVTIRTLSEVDDVPSDRPLFLFVHYFDPHSPWTSAPDTWRRRFVDPAYTGSVNGGGRNIGALIRASRRGTLAPEDAAQARALYLAEVAWADHQLGVLLDGLQQRNRLDDSLIAFLADHGETLDEIPQRAFGHGFDVDLVATHVPLILAGSGRFEVPRGEVVQQRVRLMDVGPTLLGRVGLPTDLGEGVDLVQTWGDAPSELPPHFAEATKPGRLESKDSWPNLSHERGVAVDGHLLIRAPFLDQSPALFRLAAGQPVATDPALAGRLEGLLTAWDAAAPGYRAPLDSPETEAALRALGYVE